MNTLLTCLYGLLSYITEDAKAHGFTKNIPEDIMQLANVLCIRIGDYLDEQNMLQIEQKGD